MLLESRKFVSKTHSSLPGLGLRPNSFVSVYIGSLAGVWHRSGRTSSNSGRVDIYAVGLVATVIVTLMSRVSGKALEKKSFMLSVEML